VKILISILMLFSYQYCFASDKAIDTVCKAYKNDSDRKKCYLELSPPKRNSLIVEESSSDSTNFERLSNEELDSTFNVIKMSFTGSHSKHNIKKRLETAMKLYDTPLTIEYYNRCASVLVAMRQKSGHSEMDILDYMIKMHSAESGFNFPTGAAFALTSMN